jgi:hypothetical protein
MVYDAFEFDAKNLRRCPQASAPQSSWHVEHTISLEGSNVVYVVDDDAVCTYEECGGGRSDDEHNNDTGDGKGHLSRDHCDGAEQTCCRFQTGVLLAFDKTDKTCKVKFCGQDKTCKVPKRHLRPARPLAWNPFWGHIDDHVESELDRLVAAGHPVGFLEVAVHSYKHLVGSEITVYSSSDQVIPNSEARLHEATVVCGKKGVLHLPPIGTKELLSTFRKDAVPESHATSSPEGTAALPRTTVRIPLFSPEDDIVFEIKKGGKKVISMFEDLPDKDAKKNCTVPLSQLAHVVNGDGDGEVTTLSVQLEWMSIRPGVASNKTGDDDAVPEKKGLRMRSTKKDGKALQVLKYPYCCLFSAGISVLTEI